MSQGFTRETETAGLLDYVFDPLIRMDPTQVMALSSDLFLRSQSLLDDQKIRYELNLFLKHEIAFDQFALAVSKNLPRFGELGYSSYLESAGQYLESRKEYSDLKLSKSPIDLSVGFGAIVAAIIGYCAIRDCTNTYWKSTIRTLWFVKRMARFVRKHSITSIIKEEQTEIKRQIATSTSIRNRIRGMDASSDAKAKRLEHWEDRIIFLHEQLYSVTSKLGEARTLQKADYTGWQRFVKLMGIT